MTLTLSPYLLHSQSLVVTLRYYSETKPKEDHQLCNIFSTNLKGIKWFLLPHKSPWNLPRSCKGMILKDYQFCVLSRFSCVWFFATLWTVAHAAPLSVGFSWPEHWSGLPCPPPEKSYGPRDQTCISYAPALAGRLVTIGATRCLRLKPGPGQGGGS